MHSSIVAFSMVGPVVGNRRLHEFLIDKCDETFFFEQLFHKIMIKHRLCVKGNYALAAFLCFRFLDFEGRR